MARLIGWSAGLVSVLMHVVLLTFVWVGFSTSIPREPIGFYYTGSSVPPEELRASIVSDRTVAGAVADPYPAAYFAPWINLRDVNKPH